MKRHHLLYGEDSVSFPESYRKIEMRKEYEVEMANRGVDPSMFIKASDLPLYIDEDFLTYGFLSDWKTNILLRQLKKKGFNEILEPDINKYKKYRFDMGKNIRFFKKANLNVLIYWNPSGKGFFNFFDD